MRQLSIIVPKEQLHNFLAHAGQEQTLHLIETRQAQLPEQVERYDSSTTLTRSSAIRNRVLSLASNLGNLEAPLEKLDAPVRDLDGLVDYLDRETGRLELSVRQTEESLSKLQTERERAQELGRFLAGLETAGVTLEAIGGGGFLTVLAGEISRESITDVQRALDEVTYGNLVFAVTGSSEESQTFLGVFPAAFQDEARQSVTAAGARLEPSWSNLPTEPSVARKTVDGRLDQIEQTSKQVMHDRDVQVKELGPRVKTLGLLSEVLEVRARALAGSSTTQSTCIFQAWVPNDRVERFKEGVSEACEGLVSVHAEADAVDRTVHSHSDHTSGSSDNEASKASSPPTLVRVPGWASPLQSVVNNFGVPSYHEINPLVFMLVSYPVIYGLMFGDFGEGPIFMLFGALLLYLRKKGTRLPDILQPIVNGAELVIMLGVGITVFGLVFGDFFGFESSHLFGFHGLFSPTEGALEGDISHLQQFMVIVLLFGVGHYTFGLILNLYNKLSRKEYSEAIFGPICWIVFYLTGVYLVARFAQSGFDFSSIQSQPYLLVLAFLPLGLMGWKEGGLHAFEAMLGAASNTFSYLRIWALNIADFFFKFALITSMGAIPGAILGNLLVMIIEGLIVFVQTLRLHWVEWFSKFYEGGGLSFAPYREPTGWMARVNG